MELSNHGPEHTVSHHPAIEIKYLIQTTGQVTKDSHIILPSSQDNRVCWSK